ncbi:hypothetical protein DPV73_00810 [Leptospira mayottensis]|nr:hypothetical protein DPV73_00810 [Leptospira mayottensis]
MNVLYVFVRFKIVQNRRSCKDQSTEFSFSLDIKIETDRRFHRSDYARVVFCTLSSLIAFFDRLKIRKIYRYRLSM